MFDLLIVALYFGTLQLPFIHSSLTREQAIGIKASMPTSGGLPESFA
jgi:hypothetical protein